MTIPHDSSVNGLDMRDEGAERTRTAASVLTPESRKAPQSGVIYVIQSEGGGPVKIGYCESRAGLHGRLRSIQTGNPYKLRLVHTEDGPRSRELDLHQQFARHRLVGEWFTPHLDIAERFPDVAYEHSDVTPLSTMYDLGFQDGWERGYDDAAPCNDCGESMACECPDTAASRVREDRIQTTLKSDRYYALHGSTRGMKSGK